MVNVRLKAQHLESLVIEVDICHKPLLKVSEILLLFLRLDDETILGIPRDIWRWSG
jgi:hypothetical protein